MYTQLVRYMYSGQDYNAGQDCLYYAKTENGVVLMMIRLCSFLTCCSHGLKDDDLCKNNLVQQGVKNFL